MFLIVEITSCCYRVRSNAGAQLVGGEKGISVSQPVRSRQDVVWPSDYFGMRITSIFGDLLRLAQNILQTQPTGSKTKADSCEL